MGTPLSTRSKAARAGASRRRKAVPARRPKSVRPAMRRPGASGRALLAFVRSGVEKFILNKVTVEDFFTVLRAAADREKNYSHQLTRPVFSRIVKAAIRKRNLTHTA